MRIGALAPVPTPSNRRRARVQESKRREDRSSPARGGQMEVTPPPWVGEQGLGQEREPGRRQEEERGSGLRQERASEPGRRQREAVWWEPGREWAPGAPQVRAMRGAPDRRGVAARPQARVVAWVPRPLVGQRGPGWEWAPGVRQGAPARLAWPFLRQGTRPDRGGESASGSTSDPTRHNAYPGLPTTPGQGNSHVSRETISRNRHPRGSMRPQRA